jgi:hypothetical protein
MKETAMIHLASPRLRHFSLAALGLAFSAFAAAPAAADCSAGPMSTSTSTGATYTCTRNCVATGGARVIREVTFGPSATLSQCLNECTATLGCTQVSYRTTVEMRDGVPLVRMTCTLLGAGDATTMNVPPTVSSYSGMCTRDPNRLLQYPGLQVDTRVRLESYRPGGPIQVPIKPNPNKP